MTHAELPTALSVAKALSGILNRDVKVKPAPAGAPPMGAQRYWAFYDDGAGVEGEGIWISDMALSASLGAALTLIPHGAAQDAVKSGALSGDILDNAREVANIIANCFQVKRVRLNGFFPAESQLPEPAKLLMAGKTAKLDLDVVVPGYAGGRLTFLVPAPVA